MEDEIAGLSKKMRGKAVQWCKKAWRTRKRNRLNDLVECEKRWKKQMDEVTVFITVIFYHEFSCLHSNSIIREKEQQI